MKKIKLDKDKWIQLCEKEEIIAFMAEHIPEAHSLKRRRDGTYLVTVEKGSLHEYFFRGMLETITEKWLNGDLSWYYEYDKDTYGRNIENRCRAILSFSFNAYLRTKYQKEFELNYA